MTVRVPELPPWAGYLEACSAKPVREATIYAMALNWLLGRGGTLIPWTRIGADNSVPIGGTRTLRFTIYPRYQATHRMWLVTGGASAPSSAVFTDPSGGTSTLTFSSDTSISSGEDQLAPRVHVETITSRVDVATHVEVDFAVPGSALDAVKVVAIACFELPRTALELGGPDLGINQGSLVGGRPILADDGVSLGGVAAAIEEAKEIAKRAAHFQYAVFDGGIDGAVSSGIYSNVFAARMPVLERFLYDGETRATVPVWVYTRSSATSSGDVLLTMDSGDTCTISVPTNDAGTWRSGTLLVHVEDLAVADGRRASILDLLHVEARSTGVGDWWLESLMLGPRTT